MPLPPLRSLPTRQPVPGLPEASRLQVVPAPQEQEATWDQHLLLCWAERVGARSCVLTFRQRLPRAEVGCPQGPAPWDSFPSVCPSGSHMEICAGTLGMWSKSPFLLKKCPPRTVPKNKGQHKTGFCCSSTFRDFKTAFWPARRCFSWAKVGPLGLVALEGAKAWVLAKISQSPYPESRHVPLPNTPRAGAS